MPRVLLSWIGHTDLKAAKNDPGAGLGPIAQALEKRAFDHVVLLCDLPKVDGDAFVTWLRARTGATITPRYVELRSPTDYADIYRVARDGVRWVRETYGAEAEVAFHLSPGTPPMTVVWILIGTQEDVELLQSSKEAGVQTVKLPFDIAAEFIPSIVRRADADLERLAAGLRGGDASFDDLLIQSTSMKALVAKARIAALSTAPILIEGESGTGKELLAAAIHAASGRKGKFIAVNCGAIPRELVESEFFGHVKGSFSGASAGRVGHFEHAEGGTLFLDEVGELPLDTQVKLLRAIQAKKIVRVGDSSEVPVDVRIISATNRDVAAEVDARRFREDLYFRLAVLVLRVPPLRDREGDLGPLADRLLERLHRESGRSSGRKTLSPGAKNLLLRHRWPGNVRELEATLLRALVWSTEPVISEAEMREAILERGAMRAADVLTRPLGNGFDLKGLLDEVSAHYLRRALRDAEGSKKKAAALIGFKSHQLLNQWTERLGVET